MRRRLSLLLLTLALGCGEGAGPGDTFIAFASHFMPYRTWETVSIAAPEGPTASPDGGMNSHFGGPRQVYLSQRPPAGSASYPIRTMLLKTVVLGTGSRTFAMAKRNATYNKEGALGWEFFEVRMAESGAVVDFKWRGLGPPLGDGDGDPYGVDGGCNACHSAGRATDSVLTPAFAPR